MTLPASPFFSTAMQRTQLARERFFDQGLRPIGLVPDTVLQSWTRCVTHGLSPLQAAELDPVSRSRLRATLDRSAGLLAAAACELKQLDASLAATRCKTLLTDHRGVVVHATQANLGAGRLLDTAGRVGVDIAETVLGSTAPGIVLNDGLACEVAGAEHFLGIFNRLYCVAAPIRDRSGRLAGVLDLSVEGLPFQFDALSLVRLSAVAIENQLFMLQSRGQRVLRFHAVLPMLGTPLEGLAAVNEDGGLVALNAAGRRLLHADPGPLAIEGLLGLTPDQVRCLGSAPQSLSCPGGLRLWIAIPGANPRPLDGARRQFDAEPAVMVSASIAAAPAPCLRDANRRLIEETLAVCDGNVAQAARRLGVSRGLLYRRLRQRSA